MDRRDGTYYDKFFRKQAVIDTLVEMQDNRLAVKEPTPAPCVAMLMGRKPRFPLCPCYSDKKQCFWCLVDLLNEKVSK